MDGTARRTRRRRSKRGRGGAERLATSPASSEDLVRALPKERPETLTAPPDGQLLEEVIGDLQSSFGVPQYPQEYRITIKVADKDGRTERAAAPEEPTAVAIEDEAPIAVTPEDGPRREKAPAAPRMGGGGAANETARPEGARKRKRSRRRRGRGGGGAGAGGGPSSS